MSTLHVHFCYIFYFLIIFCINPSLIKSTIHDNGFNIMLNVYKPQIKLTSYKNGPFIETTLKRKLPIFVLSVRCGGKW